MFSACDLACAGFLYLLLGGVSSGADDGIVLDLIAADRAVGIVLFFRFFIVGSDFGIERLQDTFVLCVPLGLLGVIIAGARGGHRCDAKLLENGVIIVVVRRGFSDQFVWDGLLACGTFFVGDLLDRIIAGFFDELFVFGFVVVRAIAAAQRAELTGIECLPFFGVFCFIDADQIWVDRFTCPHALG